VVNKVDKPWGTQIVWANNELYSSGSLVIKEGEQTPYVYHKERDKTIVVLQGTLSLNVEGQKKLVGEGEIFRIKPKIMHRFYAIKGDVTLIDVGTPIVEDVVVVED